MTSRPCQTIYVIHWVLSLSAFYPQDKLVHRVSNLSDLVTLGGEEYAIVAKGNVQITSGGRNLIFLNIYYVPGMDLNLFYVSQIMRHCPKLDVFFSAHKCSIVEKETQITDVAGLEHHGLYRLVETRDSQGMLCLQRVLPSTLVGIHSISISIYTTSLNCLGRVW